MYQLTMQDSSYRDYPIQYSTSPSTRIEEIDIADMWNNLLFNLEQEQPKTSFYLSLTRLLETDFSSVWPYFEIKNETSLIEKMLEIEFPDYMLEFDTVVHMAPIKEWSVQLRVKSVERATPCIVEPVGQ
jgi:hypothetical protein